jgi:hypothetical protein
LSAMGSVYPSSPMPTTHATTSPTRKIADPECHCEHTQLLRIGDVARAHVQSQVVVDRRQRQRAFVALQ